MVAPKRRSASRIWRDKGSSRLPKIRPKIRSRPPKVRADRKEAQRMKARKVGAACAPWAEPFCLPADQCLLLTIFAHGH